MFKIQNELVCRLLADTPLSQITSKDSRIYSDCGGVKLHKNRIELKFRTLTISPKLFIGSQAWKNYFDHCENVSKRLERIKVEAEKDLYDQALKLWKNHEVEWLENVKTDDFDSKNPKLSWNENKHYTQLDWRYLKNNHLKNL